MTKLEALKKLQKYCAYQDRCHQEVDLGIYGDDLENVMVELIEENFLNEERFARSYARGKFRIKKWGKVRILRELKQRQISAYCIRKGMEEIEEEEYQKVLDQIIQKKADTTASKNDYELRKKVADYAIRRGFESHLVWDKVKAMVGE